MLKLRFAIVLSLFISLGNQPALGQEVYRTDSGIVAFNASTPLEDIEAVNNSASAIVRDNGELAVVLLVREFDFRRKLMQEHFNENYLESDTYPKSYFLGKIEGMDFQGLDENPQKIEITGKLTLHGVTRSVTVPGSISRKNDGVYLNSTFIIRPETYEVEIPSLMFKKIAREVEVRFSFHLPRQ